MTTGLEKHALKGFLRAMLRARAKGMPQAAMKAEKVPKIFRKAISEKDFKKAWKGYKHQGRHADSLAAFLPMLAAEKMFGHKRVQNAVWKAINKPALIADTAIGKVLQKTPGVGKKLFTTKEQIPWGKKLHKEIERSSALAPLTKVRDIVEPIAVGVGLEKGLSKAHEIVSAAKGKKPMSDDRDLREKVASTMLKLHEENQEHTKRAHALRVLCKQAELGLVQMPQSYGELQEKLASLCTQDLIVLEKALELTGGNVKLGELDRIDTSTPLNASEKFQAAILGDIEL